MGHYDVGRSFKWWIGQVEATDDPEMLGRVRVRVYNEHDAYSDFIETEELLWAYPISPVQSASLASNKVDNPNQEVDDIQSYDGPGPGAIGWSPTGLEIGSWVFGFYFDGIEGNLPFIFGSYHKKGEDKEEYHDVSKLAREVQSLYKYQEPGEMQIDSFSPFKVTKLPKSLDGEKNTKETGTPHIKEPKSAYKAKYPFNKTFTTRSGHAVEIDDTPGHERIHIYHRKGTYTEINEEGRRVSKTVGHDFDIVLEDKNVLVKGDLTIETDSNATILVKNNAYLWIGNNAIMAVEGNVTQAIGKNVSQEIGGNVTQVIKGNYDQTIMGDFNQKIMGNHSMIVYKDQNIHTSQTGIWSGPDLSIATTKSLSLESAVLMDIRTEGTRTDVSKIKLESMESYTSKVTLKSNITWGHASKLFLRSGDVIAKTISLVGHVHPENPGHAGLTFPPR